MNLSYQNPLVHAEVFGKPNTLIPLLQEIIFTLLQKQCQYIRRNSFRTE